MNEQSDNCALRGSLVEWVPYESGAREFPQHARGSQILGDESVCLAMNAGVITLFGPTQAG